MNTRVSNVLHGRLENHSTDTYNSLIPLTRFLNLFAINAINSSVGKHAFSTFFYTTKMVLTFTVLGSLNIFCLYYKNAHLYKEIPIAESIQLTDTAQLLYDLFQYFIDLWLEYKCGRQRSQEYFKEYEYIDSVLNMVHHSTIKREIIKLLSLFTFIWFTTSVADYVSWYLSYGWIPPTVYSTTYIFLFIKILTTLDLSSHAMQIRFRLMTMGDLVYSYYSKMASRSGFEDKYSNSRDWKLRIDGTPRTIEMRHENSKHSTTEDDDYVCQKTELLTRCYLQLTEQVAFINSVFGFRILLNSLSLMIDIVRFTNIAVRVVLGTQSMPNETRYFPAVSSVMRQLTCVFVLISLANQCEKVYRQKDRIVTTINHVLINKNPSDKLRAAMTELRNLIQSRPIIFSLANFFTLDNSLLVSIASVVVTYTIILVQSVN